MKNGKQETLLLLFSGVLSGIIMTTTMMRMSGWDDWNAPRINTNIYLFDFPFGFIFKTSVECIIRGLPLRVWSVLYSFGCLTSLVHHFSIRLWRWKHFGIPIIPLFLQRWNAIRKSGVYKHTHTAKPSSEHRGVHVMLVAADLDFNYGNFYCVCAVLQFGISHANKLSDITIGSLNR